jgi:AcrR family transcriptional regulator
LTATKERIIEAASELFMQRGYAGSGLKQISESGSATIGSLYHFFPGGKTELAAETLRLSGGAYEDLVMSIFDGSPDLISGVRNCFEGAAEVLEASDYADACPIATVALEVASSDEALRLVTAEIFKSWLDAATVRFVARGVEPTRARELATTFIAALEGGFLLSRAAKDTSAMKAIGNAMVQLAEAATTTPNSRQ